jgi:transcriptional regulator GlxA family with amidase domain
MIDRRTFLRFSAALGVGTAVSGNLAGTSMAQAAPPDINRLPVPPDGKIPVAFVLSKGAVMIDFAGPWEVFQDARFSNKGAAGFELFTVAETSDPIRASGGMLIVPNYVFATAPAPKVIIIPAQSGGPAVIEWIREKSKTADVTASVCTGAFVLAGTGLLSGKPVTTHHGAYQILASKFPDVHVVRGARFVDDGNIASSGGLSSGIDLALHLVERYFGRDVASRITDQMEYQGSGWTDPSSNRRYAS